jgi:hypothetical protein
VRILFAPGVPKFEGTFDRVEIDVHQFPRTILYEKDGERKLAIVRNA